MGTLRTALLLGLVGLVGVGPVADADEVEVAELMERYEAALDHGDVEGLGTLHASWSAEQQRKLTDYFANVVAELNVEISALEVGPERDGRLRIRFVRRDRFTVLATGARVKKRIRLERTLIKREGTWLFAPD